MFPSHAKFSNWLFMQKWRRKIQKIEVKLYIYGTVLHTTVGPLNVYKKIRGTDYVVFVLISIDA